MTKYVKQELSKDFGVGKHKCYYRIKSSGNVSTQDLIEEIASPGSGLSKGSVAHVYYSLCEKIMNNLAQGKSVSLEGIGTFMASVAVDSHKPMDSIDGGERKRNAASLHVDGVNFRASHKFISDVDSMCTLTRGGICRIHRSPYTKQERIFRALEYLKDPRHHFMHVADYATLNSLSKSTATRELHSISEDVSSGITFVGVGKAKVYVMG